jgi:hypothetical protein
MVKSIFDSNKYQPKFEEKQVVEIERKQKELGKQKASLDQFSIQENREFEKAKKKKRANSSFNTELQDLIKEKFSNQSDRDCFQSVVDST